MCSLIETCTSWSVQGKDTQVHPLDLWLMSLFWPLILFPTTTSSAHQDFLTLPHAHPSLQTNTPSCSSFPLCVCVCLVQQCCCALNWRIIPAWSVSLSNYVTAFQILWLICVYMYMSVCLFLVGVEYYCIIEIHHRWRKLWKPSGFSQLNSWTESSECVCPPTYNSSPFCCNIATFCRCKLWPKAWISGIRMSSGKPGDREGWERRCGCEELVG